MLRAALAASSLVAARAQPTAALTFDPDTPLNTVLPTYLSTNIDSGSLAQLFDFTDPVLATLTANLVRAAPTQLRIGGGAADDLAFTGAGGARGACNVSAGVNVCVDTAYVEEILAFAAATGVQLVWDFNAALRDAGNAWNTSNARAMLAAVAASPNAAAVAGWQLGNEVEDWYKRSPPNNLSGTALAADYAALRGLLAAQPTLAQSVLGPDACCEERRALLADFSTVAARATPPLVSAVTVHAYPIPRGPGDTVRARAAPRRAPQPHS